MAGQSKRKQLQRARLAVEKHDEYEQAGKDLIASDQLRALRTALDLSQQEVAERAGITVDDLSRTELGGGVESETWKRLLQVLGIPPEDAWFFAPEHLAGEAEADEQIKAGRGTVYYSTEEFLAALDNEPGTPPEQL
jgi:transcriptional regulator with XRE-family HTH domain